MGFEALLKRASAGMGAGIMGGAKAAGRAAAGLLEDDDEQNAAPHNGNPPPPARGVELFNEVRQHIPGVGYDHWGNGTAQGGRGVATDASPAVAPGGPALGTLTTHAGQPAGLSDLLRRRLNPEQIGEAVNADAGFKISDSSAVELGGARPAAATDPASAADPGLAGPSSSPTLKPSNLERLLKKRAEIDARDVEEDNNGRGRSALPGGLRGALRGVAATGDWRGALSGAATGAVIGAVDPSQDERAAQVEERAALDPQIDRAQKLEDAALEREDRRSQISLRNAQRDWHTARPGIEQDKAEGQRGQRARAALLANLRLLRGQKLDAANPDHAELLERAADAGILLTPGA